MSSDCFGRLVVWIDESNLALPRFTFPSSVLITHVAEGTVHSSALCVGALRGGLRTPRRPIFPFICALTRAVEAD
jgi:hypothetical protein